jgi:hypothetical protein
MTEQKAASAQCDAASDGPLKFADHVENIAASEENPIKRGRFIRIVRRTGRVNAGTFVEYIDDRGETHLTPPDNIRRLIGPHAPAAVEPVQGATVSPSDLIRIELRQAMLDCWNAICADTDCHPLDIKHQGKKLFFEPNHWADMIAFHLADRLSHHASLRDLVASGGLPEAASRSPAEGSDQTAITLGMMIEDNRKLQAELAQARAQVEKETGRPKAFLAWAIATFGATAGYRTERLMRFVEEAIELAHADMLPLEAVHAIIERVYTRPPGAILREIGQAQACLETYAEHIGESSAEQAEIEWQRVQQIPRDEWQRRHKAKQEIGIALSPSSTVRAPE